jgi:hypothetical protein
LLAYLARQRILFSEFARKAPFDIVNTPRADGELDARRVFHRGSRDRTLEDTMRVVDGRLHDFMGKKRSFEVPMVLSITAGTVTMCSDRQWIRLLGVRFPIPQLATVTVVESWSNGRRHMGVRLHTAVIGEWFRYAGSFTYSAISA